MSEQKDLLESKSSRRIFDQVKDDSSSLCCLRDTASFQNSLTVTTERSSMLSREFDFDAEVMTSKVYKGQIRSLVRRALRKSRQAADDDATAQGEGTQPAIVTSAAIDTSIERNTKAQSRAIKILVLGHDDSEVCLFLDKMRIQYGEGYSLEERQAAKKMIHSFLHSAISITLEEIEVSGRPSLEAGPLDALLSKWCTVEDTIVPQDVAKSFHRLWEDPTVREVTQNKTNKKYLGSIM